MLRRTAALASTVVVRAVQSALVTATLVAATGSVNDNKCGVKLGGGGGGHIDGAVVDDGGDGAVGDNGGDAVV